MKKILIIAIAIGFFSGKANADTSPFQALRYIGSARATALAGCFVSMPNDPAALFYNPATAYTVSDKNFSTTFFKHVLDINSGQVSYIIKDKQNWAMDGVIGASIAYTSFGSFEYADEYGVREGSFSANDVSMSAVYSNQLDSNLYYGAAVKLLFLNLEEANTLAFAIDAGLLYKIPEKRTNIGVSVLHAGSQIKTLYDKNEPIPLDVRMGFNHKLRGMPLLVNFSFHHLADETDGFFDKFSNFSIGGEFYFGEHVRGRLGYNNQIRRYAASNENKRLSGFSAGTGIELDNFNLDYGIAQVGNAEILHRFSILFNL